MASIKQLFCSHQFKVLSENTEKVTRVVHETYGGGFYYHTRPAESFWGEPILTERTFKTCLLSCDKCGKTKIVTI